jgi:diguanylate cyclase
LTNRRGFDRALEQAIDIATEKNEPLSLLMIDIDHFKRFNDQFGHLVGDTVLRLVAGTIRRSTKGQDTAARYGGEEFAVILPNTALPGAVALAEQIRITIMGRQLRRRSNGENLGSISVSIGAATFDHSETPYAFVERADNHLYEAKRSGRNRTRFEASDVMNEKPSAARVDIASGRSITSVLLHGSPTARGDVIPSYNRALSASFRNAGS